MLTRRCIGSFLCGWRRFFQRFGRLGRVTVAIHRDTLSGQDRRPASGGQDDRRRAAQLAGMAAVDVDDRKAWAEAIVSLRQGRDHGELTIVCASIGVVVGLPCIGIIEAMYISLAFSPGSPSVMAR